MNNVFILTGLFMVALDNSERALLCEDGRNFDSVSDLMEVLTDQIFELTSKERDAWIEAIMLFEAIPSVSCATDNACIALNY
jgi:hypothetical protein